MENMRLDNCIRVCAAVIRKDGRILICTRPEGKHLAGMWEFPGGKIHDDESIQESLRRELKEELGVNVFAADQIFEIFHTYPEKTVRIHFLRTFIDDSLENLHPMEGQKLMWASTEEMGKLCFVPADIPFFEFLKKNARESRGKMEEDEGACRKTRKEYG